MSDTYDRARLVELFGDDPRTLADVERDFLDNARGIECEIRETDDLDTIARAAHRLKGTSGMIGAMGLARVAEAMERSAKADDLPSVRCLSDAFSQEIQRLAERIRASR